MSEQYGSADAAEQWTIGAHPTTSTAAAQAAAAQPYSVSATGMDEQFGSADAAEQALTRNQPLTLQAMVNSAIQQGLSSYLAKVAASTPAPPTPLTPQAQHDWVVQHFPLLAPLLNDPEVGPILLKAASQGVQDVNQLYGMLSGTHWWQTTADTARKFDLTRQSDPATAANQVDQTKAQILAAANKAGITLSGLDQVALTATRMGWNAAQVDQFIQHAAATGAKPTGGGDFATFLGQVKDLAGQYLMPISQQTATDYATRMLAGNLNLDGVKALYRQQAGHQYPYLAQLMTDDPSLTPRAYFQPLQDTIARTLEITPDQVDPLNPKWSGMMQVNDPQTKQMRAATLTEAATSARNDPRWWGTQNAVDTFSSAAQAMTKQLGY